MQEIHLQRNPAKLTDILYAQRKEVSRQHPCFLKIWVAARVESCLINQCTEDGLRKDLTIDRYCFFKEGDEAQST